jgi:hypothetical protein
LFTNLLSSLALLQDPEQRSLMELLCSGQLRELYSDHSLDKRGRDARMFTIRDDVILKLRELKPSWDPVILNEVNFLLYVTKSKFLHIQFPCCCIRNRICILNTDPDQDSLITADPDPQYWLEGFMFACW